MKCKECGKKLCDEMDNINNLGLYKLTIMHENDDEFNIMEWC